MGGELINGCGTEDKYTVIKELGSYLCPNCQKKAVFNLEMVEKKIKVVFIPVANASVKYAIFCKSCNRGAFVSEYEKDALINGSMDLRIDDAGISVKKGIANGKETENSKNTVSETENALRRDAPADSTSCPKCKTVLQENAYFCWNCGYKLKKETKTADDSVLNSSSDNSVNEKAELIEPSPLANTTELDSPFNNKRRAFSDPINLLPERKICPKCNLLYVGTKEKCAIFGCDLVGKNDG